MSRQISVLLVDDHLLLRKGVAALLGTEPDIKVVGGAGDGEEAITQVKALKPDIVVMDITMPGLSGIDATRKIRTDYPNSKIIALSIHAGKRFVDDMLDAGASGYLLKESAPEELVQGIRAVMRGDIYLSSTVTTTVVSAYVEGMTASIDILWTKLHRPTAPSDLVPRTRLLERLEAGRERRLTLVSAPAGYGKSVTIGSWLDRCDWPSAWISLDEGDSEPNQFLSYFLAAVREVFPGSCEHTLGLVNAPQLPPLPVITASLSNELDALEQPLLVVLDDYHTIDAKSSLNDLLSQLLLRPPIPLHLVILTRHTPPLPLLNLRAQDQVSDINLQDLRFTAQEVRELLERNAAVTVSNAALDNLNHEIEGWAVGLRLASLALRRTENPDRFLMNLRGGLQQTQEYLLHEVFTGQTPQMQDWLLRTAIVDRFCRSLCVAVYAASSDTQASEADADKFVQSLIDNNLFSISLDSRGIWFRYHHLFQHLLQRELETRMAPDEVATLHRRASAWYEGQGIIEHAILHAMKAGDVDHAAEIIEQHRRAEQDSDGWRNIEKWLAILPAKTREHRPGLLLAQAWILHSRNQLSDIIPIIAQLEALAGQETIDVMLKGELNLFQGILCFWEGRAEQSQKHLLVAQKLTPRSHATIMAGIEAYLGLATYMAGQRELALQRLSDSARDGVHSSGKVLAEIALSQAVIHTLSGELKQAMQAAHSVLRIAKQGAHPYVETWGTYLVASSHFRAHEMEAALPHFLRASQQLHIMHSRAAIDAMVGLALTHQAMNSPDAVEEVVRKMIEFARESQDPRLMSLARSGEARIALVRGDLESAVRWLQTFQDEPFAPSMFVWMEVPCVTQARVLIAMGSPESLQQATDLLATLRQANEALHNTCQTIDIMILQSLTLYKQGRAYEGRQALLAALELARPGRWIHPFIESGPIMADLLRPLPKEEGSTDLVEKILAHFGEVEERKASAKPGQPLSELSSEPLTNRELDILELLAQRLQNKEIAAKLCVSPETVKSHLKHLYQKLGVSNRREAAARATDILP